MSIILPQVTIQHDFQTVIAEVQEAIIPEEPFWISCYKQGHPSVHGRVKVSKKVDGGIDLIPEGLEFEKSEHGRAYTVVCPSLTISSTRLRVPRQVIGNANEQLPQVTAFDVAPDLSLYATGDSDGNLRVSTTSGNGRPLISKPHLSTILSLSFFPSSKVILTASNDFKLSIISAEDLSVPRTLKAHTRAVTDLSIISRGKNVLSCAKDGTLRLWDVASGSQIRVLGSRDYSPIYKMSLGVRDFEPVTHRPPDGDITECIPMSIDSRETDTVDKVVFCALQNGGFEAFDLGSKSSFFHSEPTSISRSALESLAYSSADHVLATGSRAGVVTIYDTRQLATSLFSFQRNSASIEDIVLVPASNNEVHFAVASADGLPYVASIRPEGPQVIEELVGYNCDAVRGIKTTGGNLWTVGDDGLIRRY
ncbi:WD40 repeat-like protein [Ramaria rubella]|nr:WD40 repeat-like protein [Ramaria rubella]